MWAIPVLFIIIISFFILIISISWSNLLGRPWVPSKKRTVHRMLTLAEVGPDDLVYDLGCGDGRVLIAAARRFGARAVGIEIDPFRYLWCQGLITVLGLRKRVRVIYGDFFHHDLRAADVLICYLMQTINNKLEDKLKQELAPGTRIVSHTFTFSGLQQVRAEDEILLYVNEPGKR